MIKADKFLSPPQAGAKVTNEMGVFSHFWLTWCIGVVNAIFTVESNSDEGLSTLSNTISVLEDKVDEGISRSSISYNYVVQDSSPPFIAISAGGINFDNTFRVMEIHENPKLPGATIPDLTDITGIELCFDKTQFISISPATVIQNTGYWDITWISSNALGAISSAEACTVVFHW